MLPTWLAVAVPVAMSCVEDTRVVVSVVVPKRIVAPVAKFVPVAVNVKAPTGIEVGVTETSWGVGFSSVTPLLPVFVVSAVSVAPIVIVFVAGGNCGAV